jgi:hypothetical protein
MKTLHSNILDIDFEGVIIHRGLAIENEGTDNAWPHDQWTIILDGQAFEFKTGIGCHRKCGQSRIDNYETSYKSLKHISGKNWTYKRLIRFNTVSVLSGKPTVDDLLYSLVLDADSARDTFANWCANVGLETDSRKALSMYEQCQNNIERLRNIGVTDLDAASIAFCDY